MKVRTGFLASLGASGITSILMLLDRVVLNFIPLLFWGVETAGAWIFIRAWAFLLMSLEGGVGGRLSHVLSRLFKTNCSPEDLYVPFKMAQRKQYVWGGGVFLFNYLVSRMATLFNFDIFGFHPQDVLPAKQNF